MVNMGAFLISTLQDLSNDILEIPFEVFLPSDILSKTLRTSRDSNSESGNPLSFRRVGTHSLSLINCKMF
jgi:hypothetical protein